MSRQAVSYDRDLVLERTDLRVLADELLGPRKGRGPHGAWRCPAPEHGLQSGRTPPVSVFLGRGGIERWHCHGCGAGGTAIDLVMVTQRVNVGDALNFLAARGGISPAPVATPRPPKALPPAPDLPPLRAGPAPLADYVHACEQHLWSPAGARFRAWLAARRLPEAVLRANHVGADPGPARLRRGAGLPRRGPAIVFPLLTESGEPAYLQARYLNPAGAGRKYDNPADALAPLPRVGLVRTPAASARHGVLLVCEGIPDALSAVSARYRAAAVLGAALPDPPLARRISHLAGGDAIVIAFDADVSGRHGAERLHELLAPLHPQPVERLDPGRGDLNDWARQAGANFAAELRARVDTHAVFDLPSPMPAPALAPSP